MCVTFDRTNRRPLLRRELSLNHRAHRARFSVSNLDVYAADRWGMNRHDAKTANLKEPDAAVDALARECSMPRSKCIGFWAPAFWNRCTERPLRPSSGC